MSGRDKLINYQHKGLMVPDCRCMDLSKGGSGPTNWIFHWDRVGQIASSSNSYNLIIRGWLAPFSQTVEFFLRPPVACTIKLFTAVIYGFS